MTDGSVTDGSIVILSFALEPKTMMSSMLETAGWVMSSWPLTKTWMTGVVEVDGAGHLDHVDRIRHVCRPAAAA